MGGIGGRERGWERVEGIGVSDVGVTILAGPNV